MNKRNLTLIILAGSALALAACSGKSPTSDASSGAAEPVAMITPGDQSLPSALDDADGMQTVAEALKTTGLDGVFGGKASYTLLAPSDDAFSALGDTGKTLLDADDRAALAALLKAHILPGYITRQDISTAIDASGDGEVKMTDMAGTELTFTKAADVITVTAPDGAKATLSGDAVAGKQSIALPLDGVLKQF